MPTRIWRYLRPLALVFLFALPLAGCAGLSSMLAAPSATAERCKAWETPKAYVGCLAEDMTQLARDYEADSRAGRMSNAAFLAAEPAVLRSRAALNDAGALLNTADTTRKQAAVADPSGGGKQAALATAAAGLESLAIGRAAVAEDQIKWLKDNLARLRAPAPPVLTAPTSLLPAS